MASHKYTALLDYIESYWDKITFEFKKDQGVHLGLPNPFVSPNHVIFRNDQFYWDSYFTILGLVVSDRVKLAKGMVDNFVYLFNRFHIVPARNRFYSVGISQPPFLTSMAFEVFEKTQDLKWLTKVLAVAEQELQDYWMFDLPDKAEKRLVYKGLSRYSDHFISHLTAEHESGWDTTSRFDERCLHHLPVDLNCLLYKYEVDLARGYTLSGNNKKAAIFEKRAAKRKRAINELMWDEKKGFFFDYDFYNKKQRNFWSLAGFYPMWCGLATPEQAKRMAKNLKKFEFNGGLAMTQKTGLSKEYKQWDYPNGWPNQHYIVTRGLLNYGLVDDAKRVAGKWMDLCMKMFKKTGLLWEKYDVVKEGAGHSGHYAHQEGFGWTNAVFARLFHELTLDEETPVDNKKSSTKKPKK